MSGLRKKHGGQPKPKQKLIMSPKTLDLILKNKLPKGNVLVAAKLAGIQAAKKTADLIPLCHPLRLTSIQVEIIPQVEEKAILVISRVSALERTGVEMEALTAAASACLTIYDMAKAFDRRMVITDLHLLTKTGGKSGSFRW
jgi:cyclic pyranopterin phosphate synthase